MFTSMALVALWGSLVPQVSRLALVPEQDYKAARTVATKEQKPLAVFVGKGDAWKSVVKDGPDAEARKLLAQRFVLVYVDQATDYGQTMAASFNLTGKNGVVISSRGGELMAYRHEGDVGAAELTRLLSHYGAADVAVTTTESNAKPAHTPPPYVAPAGFANPLACQT